MMIQANKTKVNSPWRTLHTNCQQVRPVANETETETETEGGGGGDKEEEEVEVEAEEVEKQTMTKCVSSISICISDPVILMPN